MVNNNEAVCLMAFPGLSMKVSLDKKKNMKHPEVKESRE
jgi:hypothetical protein